MHDADDEDEGKKIELAEESKEVKDAIKTIRNKAPGSKEVKELEEIEDGLSRRRVLQILGVASAGVFAGATGIHKNPAILKTENKKDDTPEPNKQTFTSAATGKGYISEVSPQSNNDFEPDIYVDPKNGDDRFYGQQNQPVKTLQEAVNKAKSGENILLREGVNKISKPVLVDKEVKIKVEEESKFVINASKIEKNGFSGLKAGIIISNCQNVLLDGSPGRIEVKSSKGSGISVTNSSNFKLRGISSHENKGNGFAVKGESGGVLEFCSASRNSGEEEISSGFGVKIDSKHRGLTFRECSAHHNSGDGFSFINSEGLEVKRCVSYRNRKTGSYDDGSGFSFSKCHNSRIHNCISYENEGQGIRWNKGSLVVDSITGFSNLRFDHKTGKDIYVYDPESGRISNCLVTDIAGNTRAIDLENNVVRPSNTWRRDIRTEDDGTPVNPSGFGKKRN